MKKLADEKEEVERNEQDQKKEMEARKGLETGEQSSGPGDDETVNVGEIKMKRVMGLQSHFGNQNPFRAKPKSKKRNRFGRRQDEEDKDISKLPIDNTSYTFYLKQY